MNNLFLPMTFHTILLAGVFTAEKCKVLKNLKTVFQMIMSIINIMKVYNFALFLTV